MSIEILERPLERRPVAALSDRIISQLRERFAAYGHEPSPDHWEGLTAIARAIEAMALGTAKPVFTYSALPTGMGKTSVVVEAVQQLVSDYPDVGVIIFVNQLVQIDALIRAMGLKPHQFAVQVGKANQHYNEMGRCFGVAKTKWPAERRKAQVLFVTQQKLPKLPRFLKNIGELFPYLRADGLAYPRQVRIWDEAIIPAKPLTISVQDALTFAGTLFKHGHNKAANLLRDWIDEVKVKPGVTEVPWFIGEAYWSGDSLLKEAIEGAAEIWDEDGPGADLLALQGLKVRVHQDPYSGATVISYRDFLPPDFAPLLILDASGHLRLVYELWGKGRGGMMELPSPGKTYHNLAIRHWERAAGKAAYRNSANQDDFAEGVLAAFKTVPDPEPLLVIYHMDGVTDRAHGPAVKDYANLELRVREKVKKWGGEKAEERLRFLHWGVHMASNEHADVRHLIVVGMLQYSQPQNEAHYRASYGSAAETEISAKELNNLRLGEVAHHLFQGVGRGAVRKCVENDVPAGCVLWVVFSTYKNTMHIPSALLGNVFPKATIAKWEPLGVELQGGNLKSKRRPEFVELLLGKLRERELISFEAKDFEIDGFPRLMTNRFVRDKDVRRKLAEHGAVLEERELPERRKGGRVNVYTLRRDIEGVGLRAAGQP